MAGRTGATNTRYPALDRPWRRPVSEHPIIPSPGTGPWRVLLLDRDPADPKWLIATITHAEEVRPAHLDPVGRYSDWNIIPAWLSDLLGYSAELTPVSDPLCWRIDESRPR
jgi:hypothetical protein